MTQSIRLLYTQIVVFIHIKSLLVVTCLYNKWYGMVIGNVLVFE